MNEKQEIKEEVNVIEIFRLIYKHIKIIFLFVSVVTILTFFYQIKYLKNIYRSDCVIKPINSSNDQSMSMRLGGFAQFLGGGVSKSQNTLEMFLNSRSFANDIVVETDLDKKLGLDKDKAINYFRDKFSIVESAKYSQITLTWDDENPKFAYDMLNVILKQSEEKMISYSKNKKIKQIKFLQKRFNDIEKELEISENNLKQFQEINQSIQIESQAQAIIEQINELKKEKNEKEIKYFVSKKLYSENNKEINLLKMELSEINALIDRLLGQEISKSNKGIERSLSEIPRLGMEYASLYRKVKINQKLYEILLEQLEMSKFEALKQIESFEIIDYPIIPIEKIGPSRAKNTLIAFLASLLISVLVILIINSIKYSINDDKE